LYDIPVLHLGFQCLNDLEDHSRSLAVELFDILHITSYNFRVQKRCR